MATTAREHLARERKATLLADIIIKVASDGNLTWDEVLAWTTSEVGRDAIAGVAGVSTPSEVTWEVALEKVRSRWGQS